MPRRSRTWLLVGRVIAVLAVAGLAGYLYTVGLNEADKLGSVIGAVVALAALTLPYLLPSPRPQQPGTLGGFPDQPTADATPLTGIDLRGARGIQLNQAGTNTQTNTFTESP